jgi:hypothetical protein
MIVQTFADDSQDDDFYTVAGYVAPKNEWDAFSGEWYAVLKQRPRLGFYRTFDAQTLSGQFDGWAEPIRDARIARLASTIVPIKNICGVAAHLSKRDFKELFAPNFLSDWDDPYYICATHLIEHVCRLLLVNPVTKVDFIFDRQGKVGRNFRAAYEVMLRPMSIFLFPFLGKVKHEDKREFLPLQAADMHASWVRRNNSTIQMWTAADCYLSRIEQTEFRIQRSFLERLAQYRREHAEEIKAFSDKMAPE